MAPSNGHCPGRSAGRHPGGRAPSAAEPRGQRCGLCGGPTAAWGPLAGSGPGPGFRQERAGCSSAPKPPKASASCPPAPTFSLARGNSPPPFVALFSLSCCPLVVREAHGSFSLLGGTSARDKGFAHLLKVARIQQAGDSFQPPGREMGLTCLTYETVILYCFLPLSLLGATARV